MLQNSSLSVALDEGTYADLVRMFSAGEPVSSYGTGWGASLYPATRAFLLPAGALASLGLEPYDSVRAVSVVYGALAQLVLLALVWTARDRLPSITESGRVRLVSWPTVGFLTLILTPSHFVWATLGLKDSASEFWAILAVFLTYLLLFKAEAVWRRVGHGLGIAASLAMLFQVRDYVAAVTALGLLTATVVIRERRVSVSGWLILGVLAGLGMGLWATQPLSPARSVDSIARGSTVSSAPPTVASTESAPTPPVASESGSSPFSWTGPGVRGCASVGLGAIADPVKCAAGVRGNMAEGANSAIDELRTERGTWSAELMRLPGAGLAVLFRPLWPFEQSTVGSMSFWLASFENYLWIGIILAALFALVGFRSPIVRVTTIAVTYIIVLTGGMALMEGNLGTAFRHKSQLLWAIAVIFALAGGVRPWVSRLVHRRG